MKQFEDRVVFDLEPLRNTALNVPAHDLPAFIGALAEATALAQRRLMEPEPVQPIRSATTGLLTADELAQVLSLPPSWIRTQARRGIIPSVKVGHYVRFEYAEVRTALAAGCSTQSETER